ncbi:GIY-YIG nuclease family protein [Lentzea californiensis]|uniref:GIY-YIG nuclease family protein n=1 Tax=Lentzea californiensis TaxID=438851 RepID=UPI0021666767|nr:GIY-YIG nuclease family protein [Lentzea californiensis]MCR3754412.1 T5orf172 domain-containing protein [Lentzea californiensis]
MLSTDELASQRERWITTICEETVGLLSGYPALDPAEIVPQLGEPALVCALLVTRIAALAAGGRSNDDIVQLLTTSPAFVGPGPQPEQLADLVAKIYRQIGYGGITGPVGFLGSGLPAWSPESTYLLLLEIWSSRRLGSVSHTQVRKELARCWGVQDARWLEACLSRPPAPLHGYPDVWATLKAEPDARVGNVAALGLTGDPAGKQVRERWADRLPFAASQVEHLFTVGGDLVSSTQARRYLRHLHDRVDREQRRPVARALEIIEDQIAQVTTAINGLSTLERELLRERSDQEHLEDWCLAALMNWSRGGEPGPGLHGCDTAHGMWGPLPWWTMTMRNSDQVCAATAALAEGILPLGFDRDSAEPDRLQLICRRPRTSSPGLRACFTFDLTNPVHAGELLAIGRRGDICIDVFSESDDEQDDPRPISLGTLHVTAHRELAHYLTAVASKALKELLPDGWETDDSVGLVSFGDAPWQVDRYHLQPWPTPRSLLVAEPGDTAGEISVETTDPPATATTFAPVERWSGPLSPHAVPAAVRAPLKNGFVYVQRSPAIPGMVKIGFTQLLSEDRADDLFGTSVPFPFEVLHRTLTSRPRQVEQAVHRLLAVHRVAANREFFRVDQQAAEEAIRYCHELMTGIARWEPMPVLHRLRAGDRVTLPLKAGQVFIITAYPHVLTSSAASIVDIWQAHTDGDVLELHLTADPRQVSGLSDNDPGAYEDPVPFLNRDNTEPNGTLIGRERLMAGDRLSWLSDQDGTGLCTNVVFEIDDFCQVTCRTWNLSLDSEGMPLLLNHVTRPASPTIAAAVHEVLALGPPRSWAPRDSNPEDEWVRPATEPSLPEHWLAQLSPRRRQR